MTANGLVKKYASAMQAFAVTLTVVSVVGTWALYQHDSYADERYVLKGELKESVDAIGRQINASIAAADNRAAQAELKRIEVTISDLEDDIIWFSEQNNLPSAKRRCRKLIRVVRHWNNLRRPVRWESDRIVQRVCDQ